MGKRGLYRTSTQRVDGYDSYRTIIVGGEAFNKLVENSETFTFERTFDDEPDPNDWRAAIGMDTAVTVKLTCRAEKRQRGGIYYSAYWSDSRVYAKDRKKKKVRKKYLGKAEAITLAKLEAIAREMADSPLFD